MSATIASRTAPAFRRDIEGLRAIAVTLVVLNHAGVSTLSGGYVGVDVFFVLSGFLITSLLLKMYEREHRISLIDFYARRARRIIPAATLVLGATVLAAWLLIGGTSAGRTTTDAQWATLFASNFRSIEQGTDYWSSDLPPSPVQHYWSLAIEEQFYFIWPACLGLLGFVARTIPIRVKLGLFLVVVIAGSLYWSIHLTTQDATKAYFSPFTRTWELAAGALLAIVTPWLIRLPRILGIALSPVGIMAILVAATRFDAYTLFPGSAALLPIVGTVACVAAGSIAPGNGTDWLLGRAPFQWIGKLSYSLYLWHWPVLIITPAYLGHDLTLRQNLLFVGVALALSAGTFWLIESPVRNSRWLKSRPSFVSVAVGGTLIVLSLVLAAAISSRLPPQSSTGSQENYRYSPAGTAGDP